MCPTLLAAERLLPTSQGCPVQDQRRHRCERGEAAPTQRCTATPTRHPTLSRGFFLSTTSLGQHCSMTQATPCGEIRPTVDGERIGAQTASTTQATASVQVDRPKHQQGSEAWPPNVVLPHCSPNDSGPNGGGASQPWLGCEGLATGCIWGMREGGDMGARGGNVDWLKAPIGLAQAPIRRQSMLIGSLRQSGANHLRQSIRAPIRRQSMRQSEEAPIDFFP